MISEDFCRYNESVRLFIARLLVGCKTRIIQLNYNSTTTQLLHYFCICHPGEVSPRRSSWLVLRIVVSTADSCGSTLGALAGVRSHYAI